MTLEDWVQRYEEKTQDKFMIPEGFQLLFLPDRGFAQMKRDVEGKMIIVYQLCGDAKFWRDMAEIIAVTEGLDCVATICTRAIKPYIRFWRWTIDLEEELSDGPARYFGHDQYGRAFTASPKHWDKETGEAAYYVCHLIRKGVVIDG